MAEEVLAQKENGNRAWGRDLTVQLGDSVTISAVLTHPQTNLMLSQVGEIRLNFTVTSFALPGRLFSNGFVEGCGRSAQKHCLSHSASFLVYT